MQRRAFDGLVYYSFDILDELQVKHAISTRHGGISPAPFHTLNLSRNVGDSPSNVAANLERLHTALGLDITTTVSASQAQSDCIFIVNVTHQGQCLEGVDGLVTNVPGIPLLLRYADCVPVLLFDPVHHAIGVVHSGWRGTVLKIAVRAVQSMRDQFGTRPADLVAGIGPSIGPCCYKVREDVISRVHDSFQDGSRMLATKNGATYLDLWQANELLLRSAGVEQIEVSRLCTADRTGDFYSARTEAPSTGRFGAIIALV